MANGIQNQIAFSVKWTSTMEVRMQVKGNGRDRAKINEETLRSQIQ